MKKILASEIAQFWLVKQANESQSRSMGGVFVEIHE